MRICGTDPAPTREMTEFEGQDRNIPLVKTPSFIDTLKTEPDLLMCWDSPLTGPPASVIEAKEARGLQAAQRSDPGR